MGAEKEMADEMEAAKGTGMDTSDDTGKNSAKDTGTVVDCSVIIPWMMAAADPKEEWWKWMRKKPKGSGEISQAAFLLRARRLGFKVALPWGDSDRYGFVVCA